MIEVSNAKEIRNGRATDLLIFPILTVPITAELLDNLILIIEEVWGRVTDPVVDRAIEHFSTKNHRKGKKEAGRRSTIFLKVLLALRVSKTSQRERETAQIF